MGSYAAHAASERDRLRAEIERLRRQVEEWRAGLGRLRRLNLSGDDGPEVTLLTLAADEIERLRDENEALQALYEQRRDLLRSCDTEVRRLRALTAAATPKGAES